MHVTALENYNNSAKCIHYNYTKNASMYSWKKSTHEIILSQSRILWLYYFNAAPSSDCFMSSLWNSVKTML